MFYTVKCSQDLYKQMQFSRVLLPVRGEFLLITMRKFIKSTK